METTRLAVYSPGRSAGRARSPVGASQRKDRHARPSTFAAALTEFAHTVVRDYDIGHMLDRLTDHVAHVIGVGGLACR